MIIRAMRGTLASALFAAAAMALAPVAASTAANPTGTLAARYLAIAEAGLELAEYSPLEVKINVVGYGRAEKCQVQLMVPSLLGLPAAI